MAKHVVAFNLAKTRITTKEIAEYVELSDVGWF
jgi:hypothetical protein